MVSDALCIIWILVSAISQVPPVFANHVCSNNCSTTSVDLNSGKLSQIKCKIQDRPCLNISNNKKFYIPKPWKKEKRRDWGLYRDGDETKIFLNFSWGPNPDSTISDLKGYIVVIKGKEIMRQHYCIDTELAFHNHSNAVLHSDCYGKTKEQEIEPGDTITVSIMNVPGSRQNKAAFEIKIPACDEDDELANVSKCLQQSQFYINVNSINCDSGGVSFNYSVPRTFQFASMLLFFDDHENLTTKLPISSNNYAIEVDGYYLKKKYVMQVWGEGENFMRREVKFDFESCIKNQETNVIPIILPIGIVFFIAVIGIIAYTCSSDILSVLRDCPGIAIKPKLNDCAIQVSYKEDEYHSCIETNQPLNLTSSSNNILQQPLYQISQQPDTSKPMKVYIVFVADNKHHQNVVLKFADYLCGDLNFDVKFELWDKLAITEDSASWMMNSCNNSQKVIVIWSPGAKKRYLDQKKNFQDMFTPVLNRIKNDLFLKMNCSKYYFGYFDYCSAQDVIPSDFQQYETRTFNLMKDFEDLYFLLKNMEKYYKGKNITQNKVKYSLYSNPKFNTHGPYLHQAIMNTVRIARECSNWFSTEEEQLAEEMPENTNLNQDVNQRVIKIVPPRPIIRIQNRKHEQVGNDITAASSNAETSNAGDDSSYMCSSYVIDDSMLSSEHSASSNYMMKGILHPPSEEFSGPSHLSNLEEESCSFLEPDVFTSDDFQNHYDDSEPSVPIFRPPVDFSSDPMESLKNINSFVL